MVQIILAISTCVNSFSGHTWRKHFLGERYVQLYVVVRTLCDCFFICESWWGVKPLIPGTFGPTQCHLLYKHLWIATGWPYSYWRHYTQALWCNTSLLGEPTVGFTSQIASNLDLWYFLCCEHDQPSEQTLELSVIHDTKMTSQICIFISQQGVYRLLSIINPWTTEHAWMRTQHCN